MAIQSSEVEEAQAAPKEPLSPTAATKASFDPDTHLITLELRGGYSIIFSPERAQGLASAAVEDLAEIVIESSGNSIYFPRLDADFSIPNMLKGRFGNDQWEKAWTFTHSADKAA